VHKGQEEVNMHYTTKINKVFNRQQLEHTPLCMHKLSL